MNTKAVAQRALQEGALIARELDDAVAITFEHWEGGDAIARMSCTVRKGGRHTITELAHGPQSSFWAASCAAKLHRIVDASMAA